MCGERQMRGPNDQTQVNVTYVSGRSEIHLFNTAPVAKKRRDYFASLPMVKSVRILKKKVPGDFNEFCERQQ
jgi:hypothetical protein